MGRLNQFKSGLQIISVTCYETCLHCQYSWRSISLKANLFCLLSRVRGSVTNSNGFWVGWLDLLPLILQLQLLITAQNQWLCKTPSILYWTTSVFSSTVTDLVLIYESVTSSASVVRWLTLHSWTLNFWILLRLTHDVFSFTNDSIRVRFRVRVNLRLAVYRRSFNLGDKPLETHDRVILFASWTLEVIVLT
jgi:hypothetical protein